MSNPATECPSCAELLIYLGDNCWRCPECLKEFQRYLNEEGFLRLREVLLP